MYPVVVAIDLETTGPDPFTDRVLEVGAAVYENGVVTRRFQELANPGVPLPPGIVKLTGITPEMIADARAPEDVLEDFLAFLPDDAPCLAHNAQFERAFLARATRDRFRHVVIDTVELSRICFPELPAHSLSLLSAELELRGEDETAHRALADCLTLLNLWDRILERARTIPLPAVGEINFLLADHARHPYRDFFRLLSSEILSRHMGRDPEKLEDLFPAGPGPQPAPPPPEEEGHYPPLDPEEVAGLFGPDGPFARTLDQFEPREGQIEMARAMARALSDGRHFLVEAGTGVGKSLAYLVPAVLWATRNQTPVVVSTNTKNLQSQLFDKDIPLVRKALGIDFQAALLKGRRNYLCLRKLFHVLRLARHELDPEERMRMANILPWAAWTETGDISENIVSGRPGFGTLWAKLSTVGDECLVRGCRWCKKCFLWKARARAQSAHLAVANHSLVFADLNVKNPALPLHSHVVFDEAHNLEEAATSHLSVEVSLMRLQTALYRLRRQHGKKAATGLLASGEAQLLSDACTGDTDAKEAALAALGMAADAVPKALAKADQFFIALAAVLDAPEAEDARPGGRTFGAPARRFDASTKRPAQWEPVEAARTLLGQDLSVVIHGLDAAAQALGEMKNEEMPYRTEIRRDLQASGQWLREITEDLAFVVAGENADYVYWVERAAPKGGGARAWAAPIAVGPLLHDQLYARKRSVTFCSATMTVRRKFDFLAGRLGIDRIEPARLSTLDAGTPFDYARQCLVAAPVFLPEPNERGRDYARELAGLLADVYRRTDGRGLALFTSYDMMTRAADTLESELMGDGIEILVQGRSGSRESITSLFKRGRRTVLLGTHSFWEGVDVVGDALSCLTIARLPFQVQTEPVVEARCERVESEGGNAFMDYSLPMAVIRFRQGFGRLIRHKTDRGVVILADRRVVAKRYGRWFLDSIAAPTRTFSDRDGLLSAIARFLPPAE